MANDAEQLIRRITEQVLCRLQGRGDAITKGGASPAPAPRHGNRAAPAPIRPPVGVCTGDYSKFPELRGKTWHGHPAGDASRTAHPARDGSQPAQPAHHPAPLGSRIKGVTAGAAAGRTALPQPPAARTGNGRSGPAAPPAPGSRTASSTGPVLAGFVTARQLQAAKAQPIRLAPDARLTPLAADYIREKKLTVERITPGADSNANHPAAPRSTRWLWWIDGHCKAAEAIAGQLRGRLTHAAPPRRTASLAPAVRDLARAVRDGRAAGGILFVHSAAQAACFANRCPSLRAVVGTCGEAVEQGIDLLAANTLIVEYPHQGPAAMRDMIDRFITADRKPLPDVDRGLQELTQCV